MEDVSLWTKERTIKKLEELYKERIGLELDIDNPVRFTEKIQWMKLYYTSKEIVQCIDKVSFKKYIADKLGDGYTAKLLEVWNEPDEVCLDGLQSKCVIKSNCSAEGRNVRIITDWSIVDREELLTEIRQNWFDRLKLCTNSFFSAYHHVKPAVFVEELIPGGEETYEYKVFCFNGTPKCLYVPRYKFVNGRESDDFTVSFYTSNWEFMNLRFGKYDYLDNIEKPEKLEQMLKIASDLARDFMFVRVDFLDTKTGLYITELTFCPSGGLIPFTPIQNDYLLGSWLTLDKRFLENDK